MKRDVTERVTDLAIYIVQTQCTLRQAATVFGIGKSTAHKDVTVRLAEADKRLYAQVAEILAYHTKVRHLRGGEATKRKYGHK